MGKLYVVRHGRTDYNDENRYLGSTDIPLNELGKKQAKDLVGKVEKLGIDSLVTSSLLRCIQTAEIINQFLQVPLMVDKRFRERKVGVYEGLTRLEAQKKHPELWSRNILRIWGQAPPGGETIQEVIDRVFEGLEEIKKKFTGRILLVTHGFAARVVNYYFNPHFDEKEFHEFSLDNVGLVEYMFDGASHA